MFGFARFSRALKGSVKSNIRYNNTSFIRGNKQQVLGSRFYSSQHNSKLPKLRYFFLIMGVGTVGFLASLKLVGEKRNKNEISESELKEIQSKPNRWAFKPDEAFVIFVLGGPGSGKGTQCSKIVKDYNFAHLSAGDLLRAEQNREGSEYGDLIRSYIKSGQIVPQEITIALLKNAMQSEIDKGTNHFLIDGFPRKMDQALTFEETVVPSKFTLFFECPETVMLERLMSRGKTSGRDDDNIDSIRKRFRVFIDQSMPVVNYFDNAGKVAKLQCDEPVDAVYARVQKKLEDHGVKPESK